MNGAQALVRTLVDAGVDVCFANPGTSEMHFVAALDDVHGAPVRVGVRDDVRELRVGEPCTFELVAPGAHPSPASA